MATGVEKKLYREKFPAGATHCLVNSTVNGLFVKTGGTAAVPVANVLNGTGQMIDPVLIDLRRNSQSLSFICAAACIVSLSFYEIA